MSIFKYYKDDAKDVAETAREQKISELEILRQSLEDKKKEAADFYDQLLRLKADFENFRRRADKEKKAYLDWGREKILVKQIALSDVLEQALKSAESGAKTQDILIGLTMINKEFSKMLAEEGVEEVELKKFDPNVCEALDFAPSKDVEDGTILAVYQKGYRLNGNLIRTAKVKVAKNETVEEKTCDCDAADEDGKTCDCTVGGNSVCPPQTVNSAAEDECNKTEIQDEQCPAQAADEADSQTQK